MISYSISYNNRIKLNIYNALGENVCQLFSGIQEAGNHDINFNAPSLPSGVYFYTIQTNLINGKQYFTSTKKMMLLK
jgi:hypothetical protein